MVPAKVPDRHRSQVSRGLPKCQSGMSPMDSEVKRQIFKAYFFAILASLLPWLAFGFWTWTRGTDAAYTFWLFCGLPFLSGFASSLAAHRTTPVRPFTCAILSTIGVQVLLACLGLVMAWEGFICLMMAFPITLILTAAGAVFGSLFPKRFDPRRYMTFSVPALIAFVAGA